MEDLTKNRFKIILFAIALSIVMSMSAKSYCKIKDLISLSTLNANLNNFETATTKNIQINKNINQLHSRPLNNGIVHKKVKRWLNGKPAIVNILVINPQQEGTIIKPSYGSYFINSAKRVKEIVNLEDAIAGVNGTYFKPDNGAPLGISIIDNQIITGPLYKRVTLGITNDKKFIMGKVDINGQIKIGNNIQLGLFNINQPVFSTKNFTIFTDKWGQNTPVTSKYYSHIVIKDNKVCYIKNNSVHIPRGGFVIVGPHKYVPKSIQKDAIVSYKLDLSPFEWNNIEYAIGGGPYLVKNGQMFIDKQKFSKAFMWKKAPRTAIGYTKSGNLLIVTIDGRCEKVTEGATLSELAQVLKDLGAYNAMNLDGGTSTQMVVNGKLVSNPTVKGGSKVTNALVIIASPFN